MLYPKPSPSSSTAMHPSATFTTIHKSTFWLLLLSVAVAASPAAAQRNAAPPARRAKMWEGLAVSTKVTATYNGRTYNRIADAQCEFDERATAGSQRVQWTVMYPPFGAQAEAAPLRTFALSVLNPAPGKAIPFSFVINADNQSPMVQTMGRPSGSGTVRIRRDGARAIFEVNGKDERGRPLAATLECSQVRKPEATGG
jgi:hypothetical protein